MPYEKVAKEDLADGVARQLRAAILTGVHQAGDLLPPERELASGFGVDRHTLRSALSELEQLGLVKRRQGSGCRVLDFRETGSLELIKYLVVKPGTEEVDLAMVAPVMEVGRVTLQGLIDLVVDRADGSDLDAMRDALAVLGDTLADGDAHAIVGTERQFFRLVFRGFAFARRRAPRQHLRPDLRRRHRPRGTGPAALGRRDGQLRSPRRVPGRDRRHRGPRRLRGPPPRRGHRQLDPRGGRHRHVRTGAPGETPAPSRRCRLTDGHAVVTAPAALEGEIRRDLVRRARRALPWAAFAGLVIAALVATSPVRSVDAQSGADGTSVGGATGTPSATSADGQPAGAGLPGGVTAGSSATGGGAGGADGPAVGGSSSAGAPAVGTGTSVGGVDCASGSRQMPTSGYGALCQAASDGTNPGATASGVTADTITITLRISNSGASAALLATAGTAADSLGGNQADVAADMRTLVGYFNQIFDLYGRQVELRVFDGQGDFLAEFQNQNVQGAQADGARARDQGAFADVSIVTQTQPYSEALVSQGSSP